MSVDTHRGTKNKRGLPFASNASFGIVIGGKPINTITHTLNVGGLHTWKVCNITYVGDKDHSHIE